MTSFKPEGGLIGLKPVFAFPPTLDNYIELFDEYGYGPLMLNSLLIAGGATALSIFLGCLPPMLWRGRRCAVASRSACGFCP